MSENLRVMNFTINRCWRAGDCFLRSVSDQLYGNSNHHMRIHTAGETKIFESFLSLIPSCISIRLHRRGGGARG